MIVVRCSFVEVYAFFCRWRFSDGFFCWLLKNPLVFICCARRFLRRAFMVFYILFSLCVREKLDKSRFSLFIVILSVSYGMIHGP